MNNKIATGIWLVFIGGLVLMYNFKIIDFNFYAALQMWPLMLVSIGISLLMQNRKHGTIIVVSINLILCMIVFVRGLSIGPTFRDTVKITNNERKVESRAKKVSHPYSEDIETAVLEINGGAAKYNFSVVSDSEYLLNAETFNEQNSLNLESKGDRKVAMELTSSVKNNKYNNSLFEVSLNEKPVWNLEFNVGAASITGDLKNLKLKSLELNSGASSVDLHLAKPTEGISEIEINTAASKIILYLPKGVACRVETDAIFSNNKYEDVDVVEEDSRKSQNFDQESNKYDIKVVGAANSLSILRY